MRVVLALGSNLGRRIDYLQGAVDALCDGSTLRCVAVSPVYETDPVGGPEQGPYLNAVVIAEGARDPVALLAWTQSVENAFGRTRERRWGPRTLDIDLIMVGDIRSDDPTITLPHPRAHERAFVLVPWAAADATAVLPGHGPIADLLPGLDLTGVRSRADLALRLPMGEEHR